MGGSRVWGAAQDHSSEDQAVGRAGWLEAIVEVSDDAIVVVDPGGAVILWSPGAERLYGYPAAEMLGRNAAEVLRAGGAEERAAAREILVAGRRSSAEVDCLRKDGTPIRVWVKRSPIRDPDGLVVAVVGVSRDVTDRRASEDRLAAGQERYRALLESTTDVITRIDGHARLVYVSPSSRAVLGWDPDELVGRVITEVVHPEDLAAPASVRALEDGGELVCRTMRIARPDGSWTWCDLVSRTVADPTTGEAQIQSDIRDVTDRVTTEARLRDSEERFRLSFENAPIGMALVGMDGRLLRVNPALCAVLGYSADELAIRSLQEIAEVLSSDLAAARRMVAGETPHFQTEQRYRRADGAEIWLEVGASLVRDEGGEPVYFIVQVQDATARRSQASALRLENRMLDELSRTDPLTGLPNRRHLEEEHARLRARRTRDGDPYTVIMVDLDNLKVVNDTGGHAAGDEAIRVVARHLSECMRAGDTVGRFGGDEFVALLPGAGTAAAECAVRRVRDHLSGVVPGGWSQEISVSVGYATSEDAEDPLAAADAEMYGVKATRRVQPPADS